ncbi:uncharacterized protein LOC133930683 [Phragmites australis]|uniref:uncharacterized protein LOC133930683 n=1 Tax=Phragmites australis TaxID=29695 RepID=UPI002D77E7A2|nr:uncharacterized protein LOC133930683 [Phragmites australis]
MVCDTCAVLFFSLIGGGVEPLHRRTVMPVVRGDGASFASYSDAEEEEETCESTCSGSQMSLHLSVPMLADLLLPPLQMSCGAELLLAATSGKATADDKNKQAGTGGQEATGYSQVKVHCVELRMS